MRRTVAGMLLGLMAASALAQQQEGGRTTAAVPSMPAVTDPVTAGASVAATTLPTVDAVRPDLAPPLDPFAPRADAMARRFRYDPSPQEIALKHHGYIHYYGNLALAAGLRGLNRVTGGREQIQAAAARDVPLDEEQLTRAARWSEAAAADR